MNEIKHFEIIKPLQHGDVDESDWRILYKINEIIEEVNKQREELEEIKRLTNPLRNIGTA